MKPFNTRLRDELHAGGIVYPLRDAQIIIECWRRHDNEARPHSSIALACCHACRPQCG
ncbi:MAG: integrase core domain-containing protein [Methylocella sp.]